MNPKFPKVFYNESLKKINKANICNQRNILRDLCERSSIYFTARFHSRKLEARYNESEKDKILKVLNGSETDLVSRYSIAKGRLKNIIKWRQINGHFKSVSDVGVVEGFSERLAEKFFDSVIADDVDKPKKDPGTMAKLRGQVLSPVFTDAARKNVKRVVAVHVTVNAISWCSVETEGYRLEDWGLHDIRTPEEKKLQIADILYIARRAARALPAGDAFVLEAPPTSLRAAGGDPASPRLLTVSLQRAQLLAMIVALVDAASRPPAADSQERHSVETSGEPTPSYVVYFLRPTLPSRLFRTLIGNERVSAEQTVLSIFSESNGASGGDPRPLVPPEWQDFFSGHRDMEKEVLGQCLLLALTFMEVCFYRNSRSIEKLTKRGE